MTIKLNEFPKDIFSVILNHIPVCWNELSLTDKKIKEIVDSLNLNRCFTLNETVTEAIKSDQEIIRRIFLRFPNIKKMTYSSFTTHLFFEVPVYNIKKITELIITYHPKITVNVDIMNLITKNLMLKKLHTSRYIEQEAFKILETHLLTASDLEMTHLSIPNVSYPSKIPTINLPKLELLQVNTDSLSYEDLVKIKINCPNIKALTISIKNISVENLIKFIWANQQLEKLTIQCFNNDLDLKCLTHNSKNLKFFCLVGHPKFGKNHLDAIKNNCKNLQVFILELCQGTLKTANLEYYFRFSPNLKYFNLLGTFKNSGNGNGFGGITNESLVKLFQKFPHIKQVSSSLDSFYDF